VWVNDAGVTPFGEAVPFEQHRRVIETNLFGAVHGVRARCAAALSRQRRVYGSTPPPS
jgi:NAD(P)-dependent dehydrogenase (short-subunit alcohol dehydrogenase family)